MALRTSLNDINQTSLIDQNKCPKCGGKLLNIDGNFVKWLTCPKCGYKKLVDKKKPTVKITPIN